MPKPTVVQKIAATTCQHLSGGDRSCDPCLANALRRGGDAMSQPWIGEHLWNRAAEPAALLVLAVVADPDLGTIVLCRAPDGREASGADTPTRAGRPAVRP